MLPKIQKSRQAHWPRFWRRAPVWALGQPFSLHIPSTGPVMLGEVWGEQSNSFYSATWSSPLHPSDYTSYWATQHIEHPTSTSWHSSLCMILPLYNGLLYYAVMFPLHHLWSHCLSSSSVFPPWVVFGTPVWYFSVQTSGKAEQAGKLLLMQVIDLHYYKGSHCL